MWYITTKEPIACEHCDHKILEGQGCLTDLPSIMPKAYRHFHIRCQECQFDRTCYEIFAADKTPMTALENVACVNCDHTIIAGQSILWDYYFTLDRGSADGNVQKAKPGLATILRWAKKPSSFNDLSSKAKSKFINAGLGSGRGVRTIPEAAEFYQSSVHSTVRSLGEKSVLEFTNGKNASHIESFANAPNKVKTPGNIIWESAKNNKSRGSLNMTRAEQLGVHAKNGLDSTRIVAKSITFSAGRAAGCTPR